MTTRRTARTEADRIACEDQEAATIQDRAFDAAMLAHQIANGERDETGRKTYRVQQ